MENFVFTRLPVDEPNDRDRSIGKDRWVKIDHALGKKIETFCINHKITKFTYMISIFNLLIALETGQDDITIGIPIAHRDHHDELKQLLGTLLNVLLIRTVIDNDEAFRELLARSENTVVNAIDNSDYPYELLNQELREIYRQDYNELYTIWFNYIPMAGNKEILSDEFNIYPLEMEEFQPRFDVMLYVYDSPGGLSLRLVYNGNLYSEKRMNRILDNYLQTIEHVLENETLTLTEIYRALQPEIADFHLDFEDDYENDDMMF
jgi:non-ribosomal peptide synthetase component F